MTSKNGSKQLAFNFDSLTLEEFHELMNDFQSSTEWIKRADWMTKLVTECPDVDDPQNVDAWKRMPIKKFLDVQQKLVETLGNFISA